MIKFLNAQDTVRELTIAEQEGVAGGISVSVTQTNAGYNSASNQANNNVASTIDQDIWQKLKQSNRIDVDVNL